MYSVSLLSKALRSGEDAYQAWLDLHLFSHILKVEDKKNSLFPHAHPVLKQAEKTNAIVFDMQ